MADHEHMVTLDDATNRWVKLTQPGHFGFQAQDAGGYLQRWALHNFAFGTGITFEGIVSLPGEAAPRLVISQPFVTGRDAKVEEQIDFLSKSGFKRTRSGRWIHPGHGLAVQTPRSGDALMTAGGIVPLTYQIDLASAAELVEVDGL